MWPFKKKKKEIKNLRYCKRNFTYQTPGAIVDDSDGYISCIRDFTHQMPTREPDLVEILGRCFTADGKHSKRVDYYFDEGLALYTDAEEGHVTKRVLTQCPVTHLLIYLPEDGNRWCYCNKNINDKYMNWIAERDLLGVDDDKK